MSFWDDVAQVGGNLLQGAGGVASMIPAVGPLVGGALAAGGTAWKGIDNYFLQQDQVQAQAQANALTREREDNAVSRRMQDMLRAGVNPMLAAGSPASAASMSVGPAAQGGGNPQGSVMDSFDTQSRYAKTVADTEGQTLANAFARGANPLQLSAMELAVNFDKAANPEKLRQLALSVRGLDIANINSALNTQAIQAGIDLTKVQKDLTFYNMVEQRFRAGGLAGPTDDIPMVIDLAAKVVALKTAGIELKNLEAFNNSLPPGTANFVQLLKSVFGIIK